MALAIGCGSPAEKTGSASDFSQSSWEMVSFTKMDSVNPVLTAGALTFVCPILNKEVKWEEKDVFNPAPVVKDKKVHLLYRAEDTIGKNNVLQG